MELWELQGSEAAEGLALTLWSVCMQAASAAVVRVLLGGRAESAPSSEADRRRLLDGRGLGMAGASINVCTGARSRLRGYAGSYWGPPGAAIGLSGWND